MIKEYLQEIQVTRPKVLYHSEDRYSKVLIPRNSMLISSISKGIHNAKAIFAADRPLYVFGLERPNITIPGKYTEKEMNSWKYASWMSPKYPELLIYYWNFIPTKPTYLYELSPEGFRPYKANPKLSVSKNNIHWYNTNKVTPLSIKKINPSKLKNKVWKIATDKEWEIKKQKYRDRGLFK